MQHADQANGTQDDQCKRKKLKANFFMMKSAYPYVCYLLYGVIPPSTLQPPKNAYWEGKKYVWIFLLNAKRVLQYNYYNKNKIN